jgi:hypothetical protein
MVPLRMMPTIRVQLTRDSVNNIFAPTAAAITSTVPTDYVLTEDLVFSVCTFGCTSRPRLVASTGVKKNPRKSKSRRK